MNKLDLYRKLPLPFKSLAASIWGYYLRWLRYSPETERLVAESHERESWDRTQWKMWREERLANMLNHAATTVPFYRRQWRERRRRGDKAGWEFLENWPVLDKRVVSENPEQFISEKSKGKRLYQEYTSGTTGKPTLIYMGRDIIQHWFALYEARTKRWLGLDYKQRWGIFGGQQIIPLERRKPPYWIWNKGLNQVYYSIFHINHETTRDYVEALWQYQPKYLIVYPSSLAVLARFILDQGLRPPPIKAIISNAEALTMQYRSLIEKAFNVRVMETYGMVEMLSQASECAYGRSHFWPETGVMEIYNPRIGEVSRDEGSGLYCMTGLINGDMPLIRYVNGDVGNLPDWNFDCSCGRKLPIMDGIQGRSKDLIRTRDGRELYILDSVYNGLPIIEGQLLQKSLDSFEVRIVPGENYRKGRIEKEIIGRLRAYLGEVAIEVREVKAIERNENGKFKPFVSKINSFESSSIKP